MDLPLDEIIGRLEKEVSTYQVPVVDLIATQTRDPFKVLVATILSARTKDEVTAQAAKRLFAQVSTPSDLARLSLADLERLIYPVGFFRNKARYLQQLPAALDQNFAGQVPDNLEALLTLPGVGRKTANLVIAVAFNKPAICVDTHVHRIMNIWGYVQTKTPLETEMALRATLPQRYWIRINSLLVAFGQGTCTPLRPRCDRCVLFDVCPRIGVAAKAGQGQERRASGMEGLRLVSWNVNGLRAAIKNGFNEAIARLRPDVLALQEIKVHPDQLDEAEDLLPGYTGFWFPAQKKGYSGTAVFSKKPPVQVIHGLGDTRFDDEGRVLTLEFTDFFLVNSYSPNAQPELKRLDYKQEFNRVLLAFIDGLRARKSVLLCGDLNVAHKEIDLANPKANTKNPGFSAEERAWMDRYVEAGLVDTFRQFNQEPGQYTWWSYRFNARAKNIGWRIDYFLIDAASAQRVVEASIHSDITGSDHCPVSIFFR